MSARHTALLGAEAGFFGKIPSRGDFVRAALPSSFTQPWDAWMSRMLAGSRACLGEAWQEAWMEAPIWYFAIGADVCGPDAAIGLWMPSVDRAGRAYPLMIAAVMSFASVSSLVDVAGGFLIAAEQAGLDALDQDLTPDALAARVATAIASDTAPVVAATSLHGSALWWTDGAPRVPAAAMGLAGLPDADAFARMLDARDARMVA